MDFAPVFALNVFEKRIKYLAGKLSVSESSLFDALSKTKSEKKPQEEATKVQKISDPERLIGLIWSEVELTPEVREIVELLNASNNKNIDKIVKEIEKGSIERDKFSEDEILYFDQLEMTALHDLENEDKETKRAEVKFLVLKIKRESREKIKADFVRRIAEAEAASDQKKITELVAEFSELIK